ncbi:MAG TPA: hypothetical protein PKW35_13675 [Nannocystaceae bacterium]|nr:hypothetical protein [Nannocystaceae bacterium]
MDRPLDLAERLLGELGDPGPERRRGRLVAVGGELAGLVLEDLGELAEAPALARSAQRASMVSA